MWLSSGTVGATGEASNQGPGADPGKVSVQLSDVAHEVVDDLWVSAMPGPEWPVAQWGVRMVVSLSEHLPPHAAQRFEWGTRGEAHGDGGVLFVHWPFEDGALPDLRLLHLTVLTVLMAVQGGQRVLLHWFEGRNRSGLVAALVTRELHAVSGAAALEHVRSRRPGMVSNREFATWLESLPPPAVPSSGR